MTQKNAHGWTEEQLSQFGTFRTPTEVQAVQDALEFANAQLEKIGLKNLAVIMEGYPYGSAWFVTAPETEPSGKARIAFREHSEDPAASIRRLLVRMLAAHRGLRE